jgi:hypothetical protein
MSVVGFSVLGAHAEDCTLVSPGYHEWGIAIMYVHLVLGPIQSGPRAVIMNIHMGSSLQVCCCPSPP